MAFPDGESSETLNTIISGRSCWSGAAMRSIFHPRLLELCAHYTLPRVLAVRSREREGRVERASYIRPAFFAPAPSPMEVFISSACLERPDRAQRPWPGDEADGGQPGPKASRCCPLPSSPFETDLIKPSARQDYLCRLGISMILAPPPAVGRQLTLVANPRWGGCWRRREIARHVAYDARRFDAARILRSCLEEKRKPSGNGRPGA